MTNFLASNETILNTYEDENMHTYTTNEETKKVLRINSLNKNQGAYK